jgi:UDP-2,4-diacetamido-2,4,6-trideoxy-beta-L-altropyranose hydrolase
MDRRMGELGAARGRRLILVGHGTGKTGLGHLMRLLALGQAWSDANGHVEALLGASPPSVRSRFGAEGFVVTQVPGAIARDACAALATQLGADPTAVAAIDRPDLRSADLDALGAAGRRVLVVDDMALLERYAVGIVLNQNVHAERASYPADNGTVYLLGPRFVLLRREFRAAVPERRIPEVGRRLLVTFGGADPTGMTRRTVAALAAGAPALRRQLEVRAIVGAAHRDLAVEGAVEGVDDGALRLTVEHDVDDMVSRMTWADLAVTSGGSTVWELARTGCPAIVVETAPAEPLLVSGLERIGLFDRLGPAGELDEAVLRAAIERRLRDRAWRSDMARRGRELVDGQGADRVVSALVRLDGR